jgi:hypothetical protein
MIGFMANLGARYMDIRSHFGPYGIPNRLNHKFMNLDPQGVRKAGSRTQSWQSKTRVELLHWNKCVSINLFCSHLTNLIILRVH